MSENIHQVGGKVEIKGLLMRHIPFINDSIKHLPPCQIQINLKNGDKNLILVKYAKNNYFNVSCF